jgi:hypothetical protein
MVFTSSSSSSSSSLLLVTIHVCAPELFQIRQGVRGGSRYMTFPARCLSYILFYPKNALDRKLEIEPICAPLQRVGGMSYKCPSKVHSSDTCLWGQSTQTLHLATPIHTLSYCSTIPPSPPFSSNEEGTVTVAAELAL